MFEHEIIRAVQSNHIDLFEDILLEDFECKDQEGMTALHHIVLTNNIEMLEHFCDVFKGHTCINAKDKKGNVPLHFAVSREAIDLLSEAGADLNSKNNMGLPPICNMVGFRHLVIKMLSKGAIADARVIEMARGDVKEFLISTRKK